MMILTIENVFQIDSKSKKMSERPSFSDDESTAEQPTPDDPIKSALSRIENIDNDDSNMGVDNFDQFSTTQTQKTTKSDSDDSDSGTMGK